MDAGELVPDDVIIGVILERMRGRRRARRLPARRLPAHDRPGRGARRGARARSAATSPRALLIDAPDEEIVRRISGRRVCAKNRPRLPRRVRPAQARGRLRPGRLAPDPARRRQARDDPQAPRGLPRADRAADRLLRGARPAAPLRRHAPARPRSTTTSARRSRRCKLEDESDRRLHVIIKKTPAEIEKMAAAGAILARTMLLVESARSARASRRASSTRPPSASSARRARRPPSRATAASRARSAPRRTRWSCTASPGPYKLAARRHPLRRHRRDARRLGRRRARARSPVGASRPVAEKLLERHRGVAVRRRRAVPPGNRLGDVSHAVQPRVEAAGLSVVRSLVGHGIGREMHEDPQVPNYGEPGRGPLLEEGMVLAIEPMVTAGAPHGPHGRRRLGDLLPGRLAGRPLRVHGRDHRRRPADPHPLAPEPAGAQTLPGARAQRRAASVNGVLC